MLEQVLRALEEAGGYASGEAVARRLQKSRTAVWQCIVELRRLGYAVEASPRKGYRLAGRPDRLYPWEIRRHLETKVIGRAIEYRPTVGSTNDVARELAEAGAPEGLVVVAEEQVKGRGRRGRSWASPFGLGIWSSTLLRPRISPFEAPKTALLAALAVCRAIEGVTGLPAEVKWPNDVLVRGRKVAGILVEMDGELETVRHLIVGIGVNANMAREHLPPEARERATTLALEAGGAVDRARLLGRLLGELERVYLAWGERGFSAILKEVKGRTAFLGMRVRLLEQERSWEGIAVDLAPDGALLVRRDGGEVTPVYAAEVSLREG